MRFPLRQKYNSSWLINLRQHQQTLTLTQTDRNVFLSLVSIHFYALNWHGDELQVGKQRHSILMHTLFPFKCFFNSQVKHFTRVLHLNCHRYD